MKSLQDLLANKASYDKASQQLMEDWGKAAAELEVLEDFKESPGWKLIEKRLKDELRLTLIALLAESKDERGGRIATLLQLLQTVNTKTAREQLEETINTLIQNG